MKERRKKNKPATEFGEGSRFSEDSRSKEKSQKISTNQKLMQVKLKGETKKRKEQTVFEAQFLEQLTWFDLILPNENKKPRLDLKLRWEKRSPINSLS